MKRTLFIALAVAVAISAAHAETKRVKANAMRPAPNAAIEPMLNALRITQPLSLPPPVGTLPCSASASDPCSSKIFLQLVTVEIMVGTTTIRKDFCVAAGYDVEVKVGNGPSKKIEYTLDILSAGIVTPQFIDAVHVPEDTGGPGGDFDGHTKVSDNKLVVKTKRRAAGNHIAFLPYIKWKNGSTWDLCAAIDPKIVNV